MRFSIGQEVAADVKLFERQRSVAKENRRAKHNRR
jgi:hypothetical protein